MNVNWDSMILGRSNRPWTGPCLWIPFESQGLCVSNPLPTSLYLQPLPQPSLSHSFRTFDDIGLVIKKHVLVFKLHRLDDSSSAAVA